MIPREPYSSTASKGKSAYSPLSNFCYRASTVRSDTLRCIVEMTFYSLLHVRACEQVMSLTPHCPFCRRFHDYACTHLVPGIYSTHYMTEYGVSHRSQLSEPPSSVQERKAARKKLLDEIWRRRRENYRHFMEKKRRLQGSGEGI
jgi:hypothetical protein